MSVTEIEKAQRLMADEVNAVIIQCKSDGAITAIGDMRFMKVAWRDPSRAKDPVTGKLSCFGKIITDNSVARILPSGQKVDQWMLMPENYNPKGLWVPSDKIRILMTGADGKNASLTKEDGGFHSLRDGLKNAKKLAGAAAADGVSIDLSLGDDDLSEETFCFWQACFVELSEDDDAELETYQEILSYGAGSGAEVCAVLMTGQGTSVKVLEGGYGSRTKLRPSLDVDGKRHEFNLAITAMCDEHGKTMAVEKSGTESKESAMRAAAKGLSVEVPVGFGAKKVSSSIVALVPMLKQTAPYKPMSSFVYTPPVYVAPKLIPDVVYLTIDPVSKMGVYSRKWTNGVFHRYNIEYYSTPTLIGAPVTTQIVGYTPAAYGVFMPDHVMTYGVIAPGFTVVPDGPVAIVQNSAYTPPAPCYRGLGGKSSNGVTYRSLGSDPTSAPDEEEEEEEEDELAAPCYRSMGSSSAPAAATSAMAMEEEEPAPAPADEAVDAEEAVVVDDPAPDTSNDAAIASAMADAEATAVPPALGKRTLSEAEMRKPETNMFLTRQSRSKKSAGLAPKISKDVKRGKEGAIIVTETIYFGIPAGKKPTKADILAVDKLIRERMDAAIALGGKEKSLDSTYSEVKGAASSLPMSLATKCDVAATQSALVQAPIFGVPVGLF